MDKTSQRKIYLFLLVFLVLAGIVSLCLWPGTERKTVPSVVTDIEQIPDDTNTSHTEANSPPLEPEAEVTKAINTDISDIEQLPLFEEGEVRLTPYKPGSLIYHVDRYVKDETENARLIGAESFDETLLNIVDWKSNYNKLIIDDAYPPVRPSGLKLIVFSRRFAKLMEHGYEGLTEEGKLSVIDLLKSDLVRWKKLYAEGQRIRAPVTYYGRPGKRSEELIVPLSMRINVTTLFIGQFSIEKALGPVLESVETFGVDTNFSAVGYACDKILSSLNPDNLSGDCRGVIDKYHTWRTTEKPKILEYKTLELPSYRSSRRPAERATSLGAALDFSKGKIRIELPPQFRYLPMRDEEGYYDPTGSTEILKKVINFAKDYCKAKP
ncbi:MAG: hypothetical protein ACYSWP_05975 [Planctomycetota bacterium]|jgi:hypothetical protein